MIRVPFNINNTYPLRIFLISSPVEMWLNFKSFTNNLAKVPFPTPGAPNKTNVFYWLKKETYLEVKFLNISNYYNKMNNKNFKNKNSFFFYFFFFNI